MSATSAPIDQNVQSGKSVESSEHYGNPRESLGIEFCGIPQNGSPSGKLRLRLLTTAGKKPSYERP